MNRYSSILLTLLFVGVMAGSAMAQGGGNAFGINKLICFSGTADGGYGGTCTLSSKGAKNSALLNTTDGNVNGSYAGVYSDNKFVYGRPLSSISTLRFSYAGSAAGAGAPRFSFPIDTDGNGSTDAWGYLSALYCNDGAGNVNSSFAGCTFYTSQGGPFVGLSGLTSAYPGAKIATDNYVFIVADEPGIWTISNVNFGGPGNN